MKNPINKINRARGCRSLWLIITAACLLSLAAVPLRAQTRAGKLNVVFILADDLGWTDLGCYGSTFYETPHIDALARDGMRFTRAYAACPVCSPTRASILTGEYPVRTRVTDIINPRGLREPGKWKRNTPLLPAPYALQLPLQQYTLAEAMKAAGYKTYMAGKWHLGSEGYWPLDQGFDIDKGGFTAGQPPRYFSPYKNPELSDGPAGEYLPERLSEETAAFIRKNKDTAFFIYYALYLVHTPLRAKRALIEKYRQKKKELGLRDTLGRLGNNKVRLDQGSPVYAAMVEAMDDAVGKVVEALKQEGLYDKTLIIFTSDNGGLSTSEGRPTSNLPLKGGKGWMYEGGIREPLIVRLPGVTRAGAVSDALVSSPDFYPTIMHLVGRPMPAAQHEDGIDLTGVLAGKREKRRTLYWHYPHYSNQGGRPASCIMTGNWKLIKWYGLDSDSYGLYNLKTDPGESHDLSRRHPRRTAAMESGLEHFLQGVSAKYPTPNPHYKAPAHTASRAKEPGAKNSYARS
jgi:arylsulfatase A-like enzyme